MSVRYCISALEWIQEYTLLCRLSFWWAADIITRNTANFTEWTASCKAVHMNKVQAVYFSQMLKQQGRMLRDQWFIISTSIYL